MMSAMTEQVPAERVRCRATFSEFDGLRIEIPGRLNRGALLVSASLTAIGTLIALGWLGCRGIDYLVTQDPSTFVAPPWLILCSVITCHALVALIVLLWPLRCREVFETDGHVLVLSSRGYPLVPRGPRIYGLSKVSNLRYAPLPDGRESLAFDFDGLTIYFGRRLTERESRRLIQTIKEHYKIPDREAEPIRVNGVADARESIPYNDPQHIRSTFDDIDGLRITVSCVSKLELIVVMFFVVQMLILAALFELSVFRHGKRAGGGLSFMFVFFSARLMWELWAGAGREIIRIDGSHVVISRVGLIRPGRRERVFSMEPIRKLRYAPMTPERYWAGSSREAIAFEAGDETVRFGRRLSELDSRRLIRTIKDRYEIPDDQDESLPVEIL